MLRFERTGRCEAPIAPSGFPEVKEGLLRRGMDDVSGSRCWLILIDRCRSRDPSDALGKSDAVNRGFIQPGRRLLALGFLERAVRDRGLVVVPIRL